MSSKIWIPRPHYYFTNPLIRRLIKTEERLNTELYKKIQADKTFVGVFRPVRLFLIYEQLLCMAIQSDGVLRYGSAPYTAYILADVLDGDFNSEEIDQAVQVLVNIGLLRIEEDRSIILTCFEEDFPTSGDAALAEDANSNDENLSTCSPFIRRLIKKGYIDADDRKNKKGSKIQDFENFFIAFKKSHPKFDEKSIMGLVENFMTNVSKKEGGVQSVDKSRLKYFSLAMENAIKDINNANLKKSVDELDYQWPI